MLSVFFMTTPDIFGKNKSTVSKRVNLKGYINVILIPSNIPPRVLSNSQNFVPLLRGRLVLTVNGRVLEYLHKHSGSTNSESDPDGKRFLLRS